MRESSENLATCLAPSFICAGEQTAYFAAAKSEWSSVPLKSAAEEYRTEPAC